jgi:exodeoxyribonuclease VII large subunit
MSRGGSINSTFASWSLWSRALDLAFRQLRDRLNTEGLFDPWRKRKLPRFPARIAVVTSPTGAAIHDILQTLRRRFPCVTVYFLPVKVQGEGAAGEIADAIYRLNAANASLGGIDIMIVGRGGGSLEDLWAFNEEVVARAIYASDIPIVSAVGHEVDVTIVTSLLTLRGHRRPQPNWSCRCCPTCSWTLTRIDIDSFEPC